MRHRRGIAEASADARSHPRTEQGRPNHSAEPGAELRTGRAWAGGCDGKGCCCYGAEGSRRQKQRGEESARCPADPGEEWRSARPGVREEAGAGAAVRGPRPAGAPAGRQRFRGPGGERGRPSRKERFLGGEQPAPRREGRPAGGERQPPLRGSQRGCAEEAGAPPPGQGGRRSRLPGPRPRGSRGGPRPRGGRRHPSASREEDGAEEARPLRDQGAGSRER